MRQQCIRFAASPGITVLSQLSPTGFQQPAAGNFLQQQAKSDEFIDCYNNERPHQALDMQCPAQLYRPSPRRYQGLSDVDYPFHDRAFTVTTRGRICFNRRKINPS
jgi:putative transposase